MILHAYVDVYVLCVCIVNHGHGYTTLQDVTAIMMFYSCTKVKVSSLNRHTDFIDVAAGVLRGNTLVPYLFIICLDYVLVTSIDVIKEIAFTLKKAISRRYLADTIMDVDNADDIALFPFTLTLAKSLLHSLEPATRGIGFHWNAHKTVNTYFNQVDISTLNGCSLKFLDKPIYLASNRGVDCYRKAIKHTKVWIKVELLPSSGFVSVHSVNP